MKMHNQKSMLEKNYNNKELSHEIYILMAFKYRSVSFSASLHGCASKFHGSFSSWGSSILRKLQCTWTDLIDYTHYCLCGKYIDPHARTLDFKRANNTAQIKGTKKKTKTNAKWKEKNDTQPKLSFIECGNFSRWVSFSFVFVVLPHSARKYHRAVRIKCTHSTHWNRMSNS